MRVEVGNDTRRLTDALALALAHDLANYLTAILNLCAAAQSELPEGSARDVVDEIREIASTAAEVTAQARVLGPAPTDELPLLDLAEVVREALPVLRSVLGRDVSLEAELPDGECLVRVARGPLEQALTNLTLNARDAMPSDGTVRIAVREDADGVELEVADRGSGMPPDVVARAAEPFFTTKAGRGTGLGLAIVRMVARETAATMDIESTPGEGTVVRLLFAPGS